MQGSRYTLNRFLHCVLKQFRISARIVSKAFRAHLVIFQAGPLEIQPKSIQNTPSPPPDLSTDRNIEP